MQSYKFDEVIEKACERKDLDKDLMKSISNFVFTEAKKEMGLFRNLRITLEGLLTFFYGKSRLEDFKEKIDNREGKFKFVPQYVKNKSEEEVKEISGKVENLLSTYSTYIKEKKEIKENYKKYKNEQADLRRKS